MTVQYCVPEWCCCHLCIACEVCELCFNTDNVKPSRTGSRHSICSSVLLSTSCSYYSVNMTSAVSDTGSPAGVCCCLPLYLEPQAASKLARLSLDVICLHDYCSVPCNTCDMYHVINLPLSWSSNSQPAQVQASLDYSS